MNLYAKLESTSQLCDYIQSARFTLNIYFTKNYNSAFSSIKVIQVILAAF